MKAWLSAALRAWLVAGALAASVGGCGGGGDDGIDPFWVGPQVGSADLDGDGLPEVITLSTRIESFERQIGLLKVYRQTAPGVFAAPVMLDAAADSYTVALGDFDGDARLDIVASGRPMQWLRQDPTQSGRFLAPQPLDAGHWVLEVATADLDGDGRLDLAAGGGEQLSVLLQTADGFAAPQPVATTAGGGAVKQLAAADPDGDGRRDLMFVYGPNDEGDVLASEVGLLLLGGDTVWVLPQRATAFSFEAVRPLR